MSAVSPFSVTVEDIPDRELGPLLTQLARAGFDNPIITPAGTKGASAKAATRARRGAADLPADWRLVREREGESYRWPKRRDRYAPYRVFVGSTRAEGAVHLGLGETTRKNAWGRDRKYVVAFLSSGSPQEPLVEFVATDDYEQTRELVAVIRGSDGARRMYGAGDALPALYTKRFKTQIYNERITHPGAWNKLVVVAHEDDNETMLNHALIQSRRRYRT
jgi:peptidoglycan hydrolase-like protein with peptidoglycan-binding domain